MHNFLTWYCQFFGYESCAVLSTFESLVLAGVGFIAASFALGAALGIMSVATNFWSSR
jgi:hypothetical protein